MNKKEIYKIWASDDEWSKWVRPVPFIDIDKIEEIRDLIDYTLPIINYKLPDASIIILDEEGVDAVKEGIALSKLGYRPIPVFNGTNSSAKSVTNNLIISKLLVWGAMELKNINLSKDALPVFLLDSNRLLRYKEDVSIFDNSWDIYHQDLPTYKYLINKGIKNVIIKGNKLNDDLSKIVYNYYKNGIKIFFTNGYNELKEIKIKKPKSNDF